MKNGFRQSMAWLHTWAGLVIGWVLFFMFLTGTAGYFDVEINRWMQPERPLVQTDTVAPEVLATALEWLYAEAPDAERWSISFPHYRNPDFGLFWRHPATVGGKRGRAGGDQLDPATGESVRYRETGGGELLYRMHWRLHYMPIRAAEWIVGACTMVLFVLLLTGIIIHRRILRDFFTFRPGKGQRSWLDAHNVLSFMALPFHLMITWSGLLFFGYLYMAPVVAASYGFGEAAQQTYFDELFGQDGIPARASVAAPLTPIELLLRTAESRMGAGEVRFVYVYKPGDANARIVIAGGSLTPSRHRTEMTFDGATGELLRASVPRSAPLVTYQTLLGLHEGLFAGPVLRWVYFLSGLGGTAMIGAGLVLWTTKRRAKIGDTVGFQLVERLNIGTIVGLPVAIAAYFWANRLIPVGIEGRAAWEAHAMFIAWAVMLAHAFIRPASRGWAEQLWVAAGAFGLLPLLNALTTDRHLGVTLPVGAWELAGFDLTVLAFGIAFAVVAWRIGRRRRSGRTHDKRAWAPTHRETEAAE